ncbi:unnamed protein product [Trichogramma brassicae]|uniref:Uncharacterized protein n=1 Tax=Trichogramma brassicae TaxID=86971 RepID=A0A6H5IZY8_9HYME|nr:unnamed protein product [Trichogramma brassicae]
MILRFISHGLPANIGDLLRNVTKDANAVCEWATTNGLTSNAAKTKVMLIGSLSFVTSLRPTLPAGLNIGGEIVPFSEEIKTLGVFLSGKFNWDRQIAYITSKVHHSLYALHFYKHALSRNMRLMLVGALVAPHLNYPASLLTDLTKEQTLALQQLQNACIRFMYDPIPRTAHVTPYRLALGWLSAGGRREVIHCSLASRIIRDASPGYLRSGFRVIGVPTETEETRQSARRRPPVLYYKAPCTASLDHSFAFSSAIAINKLPFITNILSPPSRFKSLHTSFLMQHEKADWLQQCGTEGLAPVPPELTQSKQDLTKQKMTTSQIGYCRPPTPNRRPGAVRMKCRGDELSLHVSILGDSFYPYSYRSIVAHAFLVNLDEPTPLTFSTGPVMPPDPEFQPDPNA